MGFHRKGAKIYGCIRICLDGIDRRNRSLAIQSWIAGAGKLPGEDLAELCGTIGRRYFLMVNGQRVVVVMPAYKAAATLEQTINDISPDVADELLLVDDASPDDTASVAQSLGLRCIVHPKNRGYGGNQKTCYTEALRLGADIVIMLHPDYQYDPKLIGAMAWMVGSGNFDVVLASRILGTGALKGGMPYWKYVANRFLTATENWLLGIKLSEYHTGYRAFSRRVLETLPLEENSDDFVFDNEMLAQAVAFGFNMGEISCPTRYFPEASSINFRRSVIYGLGVLRTALEYRLHVMGLTKNIRFDPAGKRLATATDMLPPATE